MTNLEPSNTSAPGIAQALWAREGGSNITDMVCTLAKHDGPSLDLYTSDGLAKLTEKAFKLSAPVLDWESAAREAGGEFIEGNDAWRAGQGNIVTPWCASIEDAAQEYCVLDGIDPHERAVFEHWIVSEWLADKIEARGEKVDRDFAGLTIWARTRSTSDCPVEQDPLLVSIAADREGGKGWLSAKAFAKSLEPVRNLTLQVSRREESFLIAAIRMWQQVNSGGCTLADRNGQNIGTDHFEDIASCVYEFDALTPVEVDNLACDVFALDPWLTEEERAAFEEEDTNDRS